MWTSILSIISLALKLFNKLLPSWEYQAGKKAALLEQSAIKDKLDAVYDKIDREYISPDDAIRLLILRSKSYYGEVSDTKTSTSTGASMRTKAD